MHALASGLIGAGALTALHESVRQFVPDAPRMDVVAMRGIAKAFRSAGLEPPDAKRLYLLAMAGDLVSNAIYYTAVPGSRRTGVWARAVVLGLGAGMGAVLLPEPMGLGKPPHVERLRTRVLTVTWYLAGALAAAAAATRNGARA